MPSGPSGALHTSGAWSLMCYWVRCFEARPDLATAHGYRSLALSASWAACLKPLSPLLVCVCVGLKPPSPLRVRNDCFWCIFRVQR